MRHQAEQVTRNHRWRDFAIIGPGFNGDPIALSAIGGASDALSGGGPDRIGFHGGKNLSKFFAQGDVPNGIAICAWLEAVSSITGALLTAVSAKAFKFRVDAWRQKAGGWLDRVAYISAVTGMYKLSARMEGIATGLGFAAAATGSAHFADYMAQKTSYNNGISFIDAGGNDGKTVMWWDNRGAAIMAINLVSTVSPGCRVGFGITGM